MNLFAVTVAPVAIPLLGEDPLGAGPFIIMGLCIVIMIALVLLSKKKKDDENK